MSEMRKAARALVERRTETFESLHDVPTSQARLAQALEHARITPDARFEATWRESDGQARLDVAFAPAASTLWMLRGLSLGMLAFVALTFWILAHPGEGAHRFLVPLFAVLSVLGLPFLTLGLSSARQAREATIRRAIRVALRDEEEAFPARQKWADED